MKKVDTKMIQQLREETGAGIMDAKQALEESQGDLAKAILIMKKKGQKIAAQKKSRTANEGVIGYYVHANNKIGAQVALACETDFVAKTDDFKDLAHDIAMHITAADPQYLSAEDVPRDIVAKEEEIYLAQVKQEKKPDKIWDQIVKGKLKKFYSETCLLSQPFVKDDSKSIQELIQENVLKLGENIRINSFKRLSL
ncbi:elongation factor Ts [Patescibacteria group bacterium]|nr:elongation factor Ts [Patescibacteria group bacterium]